MHVKNIHSMIEKLSESAKCELNKSIEKIDTKELGEVAEIIKELSEAEYYAKISKAMDESEYGVDYDWKGAYDEHERKGYRGQPRDSRGRYMSRRGRRMGYEEPMMMYDEDWDEMQKNRDMDRKSMNRMYYGGSVSDGGMSNGSQSTNRGYSDGEGGQYGSRMQRDSREGRSGMSRRGYMETKEMHKSGSSEDKQATMKELEKYMKELSEDMTELLTDMDASEKQMVRSKLQTLASKVQ